MSTAPNPLVHAFAQLQSATTDDARNSAAGLVYTLAHPQLTRRCTALMGRLAPGHYFAGEDMASAALVSVLLDPVRARSCVSTTEDGILTFLQRVARFDVQDLHEVRVARERRAAGLSTEWVELGAAELVHRAVTSTRPDDDDALWHAYARAVRRLPPSQRRLWQLCVEQELPMAEVADDVGVDRSTVWRNVRAAAARLREQLEPFHRARQLRPAFCAIVPTPRR
jgi:DNA-directed RNA polymerase specialized sigma24 family protein